MHLRNSLEPRQRDEDVGLDAARVEEGEALGDVGQEGDAFEELCGVGGAWCCEACVIGLEGVNAVVVLWGGV